MRCVTRGVLQADRGPRLDLVERLHGGGNRARGRIDGAGERTGDWQDQGGGRNDSRGVLKNQSPKLANGLVVRLVPPEFPLTLAVAPIATT